MGIQTLVVFVGLAIALTVGIFVGTLEIAAPLAGWLVIGLMPVLWAMWKLTEQVIGRKIWKYTAPYPYRWMKTDSVTVIPPPQVVAGRELTAAAAEPRAIATRRTG